MTAPAYPKPTRAEKTRQPLRRKRWMRRQLPRRLSRASSDPAYLAWVRTLPCLGDKIAQALCRQPIHAHHAGRRPGIAMKADDSTAIPLCELHHADWHNAGGIFRGLSKFERFAWAIQAIAETQRAWGSR
jgi:hypothetical protein